MRRRKNRTGWISINLDTIEINLQGHLWRYCIPYELVLIYCIQELFVPSGSELKITTWLCYLSLMITNFCKQTGFLGLWGKRVDAIDFYTSEVERLSEEVRNASLASWLLLLVWILTPLSFQTILVSYCIILQKHLFSD